MLEEKDRLLDVISTRTTGDDGIHVYIGDDSERGGMKNTAMIFKNVVVGGKQLSIGVIGPKRMNYSKVIEMINGLARGIDANAWRVEDAMKGVASDMTLKGGSVTNVGGVSVVINTTPNQDANAIAQQVIAVMTNELNAKRAVFA